jgi:hypothetical protein
MEVLEFLPIKERLLWLTQKTSVDHDNTICNSKGAVTQKFNKDFGTNHKTVEINRWHSVAGWAQELGYSKEEAIAINNRYWYDPNIINQAEPIPGAIEFLQIVNRGDLIINSSRAYGQLDGTVAWYRERIPFIRPEQIIVGLPDVVVPGDIVAQAVSKVWTIKLFGSRSHVEDVVLHAKFVLDYTDAFVFLLSDDPSLDEEYKTRLMRFGGQSGQSPDLTFLVKLLSS